MIPFGCPFRQGYCRQVGDRTMSWRRRRRVKLDVIVGQINVRLACSSCWHVNVHLLIGMSSAGQDDCCWYFIDANRWWVLMGYQRGQCCRADGYGWRLYFIQFRPDEVPRPDCSRCQWFRRVIDGFPFSFTKDAKVPERSGKPSVRTLSSEA